MIAAYCKRSKPGCGGKSGHKLVICDVLLYKETLCDFFTIATPENKKINSQSPPTCTDDTHSEP